MNEPVASRSQQPPRHLRVLLFDDQVLFTEALTTVLSEQRIDVVTASSRKDLFAQLCKAKEAFDLVLLDMSMSSTQAFQLLIEIRAKHPTIQTSLLMGDASSEVVRDAIGLGAIGVIARDSNLKTLVTALRFMAEGEHFLPASVLLSSVPQTGAPSDLGPDERAILRHLSDGGSNRDIANVLGIPETEIKSQIKRIFRKLGVNNRTRAAVVAREKGYL